MDWKNKTCETCVYRIGTECHRFPHSANFGTWEARPKVSKRSCGTGIRLFAKACAEYVRTKIGDNDVQ